MLSRYLIRKLQQKLAMQQLSVATLAGLHHDTDTLVIYVPHELSETLIYPLVYYRKRVRNEWGRRLQLLTLARFMASTGAQARAPGVKHVLFMAALNESADKVAELAQRIRQAMPQARLSFMDWRAPLDLRDAVELDPFIDFYLKKQTFTDPMLARGPFIGDTNLSDYYNRRLGVTDPVAVYPLPDSLRSKLVLGPNFAFSPQMLDLFLRPARFDNPRPIDMHARMAVNGVAWYQAMREEAYRAAKAITGARVVIDGRVKRPEFFREMHQSKTCFSPFGYGEVCWRDFEAYATGAVLLKPAMDHAMLLPPCYQDGVHCVALRWDLADLPERLAELLDQPLRRLQLAHAAHATMQRHVASGEALAPFAKLLAAP